MMKQTKPDIESLLALLGTQEKPAMKPAPAMSEGEDVASLIRQLFASKMGESDMEEEGEEDEEEEDGLDVEDLLAKLLAGKLKGDG